MPKGAATGGSSNWYALISTKNCAGLRRRFMSDVSIESIANLGAVSAFLFAAATGITSRRGIQLIVVGMLFWWLPTISRAAGTWITGQKGSHERSGAQRVGRTYCSPEMD